MDYFISSTRHPDVGMTEEAAEYYLSVLEIHANKPPSGRCEVCNRRSCVDWRDAYDKLAEARYPMSRPSDESAHSHR